jgi:hypothetical protein
LVDKFHGRLISEKSIIMWMRKVWKQNLGYAPIFHLLARDWITVVFQIAKELKKHPKGEIDWDSSILSHKNWTPLFDPMKERANIGS